MQVCHLSTMWHTEDSSLVDYMVKNLQQEGDSHNLIYKPQHQKISTLPQLTDSSFILVLQTGFQGELFTMFSTEIVCADSIHKNNAYRLNKLIILLVPDEFGKGTGVVHPKCLLPPLIYCTSLPSGHPIAWCISDCENNVAQETLLQSYKSDSGDGR